MYMVSVQRAARKKNPNPNSHDHCLLSKWKMSYVCAYSSVQLDKSRVEKEFTVTPSAPATTGGWGRHEKYSASINVLTKVRHRHLRHLRHSMLSNVKLYNR